MSKIRTGVLVFSLVATALLLFGNYFAGNLERAAVLVASTIALLGGLGLRLIFSGFRITLRVSTPAGIVGGFVLFGLLYWKWSEIVEIWVEPLENMLFYVPIVIVTICTVALYLAPKKD